MDKILIHGELDKKCAWGISCLFGGAYFLVGIILGVLLYVFELIELGGCIAFFAGGFILGVIFGACMYLGLYLAVNGFKVADTSFWIEGINFNRKDILFINDIAFSGIQIRLRNSPYRVKRIKYLKNRDEIKAILIHKPTLPVPVVDSEPMYEDCKVAVDEEPMYEDYKVAVEEPVRPVAIKANDSQREGIQLLLRVFSEIAQEQQKAVKPKRAISPQQRVGAQALVNTLSKIAKKRQKEEEATRKEIAKKRRQEKEEDLNALQTLFVKGHLTRKEYEEKKKRILRVTTTTYPLK
ncbi:MAG: hypothetical protein IKA57_03170 [Clostridia bacterium]|nr:hypothetical protein [Clostridia bacterium]